MFVSDVSNKTWVKIKVFWPINSQPNFSATFQSPETRQRPTRTFWAITRKVENPYILTRFSTSCTPTERTYFLVEQDFSVIGVAVSLLILVGRGVGQGPSTVLFSWWSTGRWIWPLLFPMWTSTRSWCVLLWKLCLF